MWLLGVRKRLDARGVFFSITGSVVRPALWNAADTDCRMLTRQAHANTHTNTTHRNHTGCNEHPRERRAEVDKLHKQAAPTDCGLHWRCTGRLAGHGSAAAQVIASRRRLVPARTAHTTATSENHERSGYTGASRPHGQPPTDHSVLLIPRVAVHGIVLIPCQATSETTGCWWR